MRIKIFFDTEFTGISQDASLISLGMVSENDEEFYAEFNDVNWNGHNVCTPWVKENVLPKLESLKLISDRYANGKLKHYWTSVPVINKMDYMTNNFRIFADTSKIKHYLKRWLSTFGAVEIWGDTMMYDWVLFCEIFKGEQNIPSNILYIPFDIATLFRIRGIDPDISRKEFAGVDGNEHNALWDAKIIKTCHGKLMDLEGR